MAQAHTSAGRRPAFTLVEILVVVAIIVVIASITAAVLPSILRTGKVTQGANMIQGMLLAAKQRAARDRTAAGVRFIVIQDTLHAPANFRRLICTEMAYVVQPDDLVISGDSMDISPTGAAAQPPFTATTTTQDFAGGMGALQQVAEQFPVQAGDYLEVSGAGLVCAITDVGPTSAAVKNQLTTKSNPSNGRPVTDYRVIRMPRRVPGEDSVKLPEDVTVLLGDAPNLPATFTTTITSYTRYSINVPMRVVPFGSSNTPPATFYYEIVFSPSGAVVGAGTNSGDKISIFVRDGTRDNITEGEPALVVVNPRTGAIAVQPVDPTASGYTYDTTNPPYGLDGSGAFIQAQPVSPAASGYYTFAQDPRPSGM